MVLTLNLKLYTPDTPLLPRRGEERVGISLCGRRQNVPYGLSHLAGRLFPAVTVRGPGRHGGGPGQSDGLPERNRG